MRIPPKLQAMRNSPRANPRELTRAEGAYRRIKAAIFDFVLLPGEGFTESDMGTRARVSESGSRRWTATVTPSVKRTP